MSTAKKQFPRHNRPLSVALSVSPFLTHPPNLNDNINTNKIIAIFQLCISAATSRIITMYVPAVGAKCSRRSTDSTKCVASDASDATNLVLYTVQCERI